MGTEKVFRGRIGITYQDSEPDWPSSTPSPNNSSPNVLIILLDDTGFGNLGCYGSTIETPNIDALAENGLRYNNFHVTPLCSPTRAALLTGRNHHSVGMANVAGYGDTGFPNHRSLLSQHAATLAEMLREEGYANFALGKWHLNPKEHNSAAGPHYGWPVQRGFDRFYGFLPGATNQFYPELTHDNHSAYPPKTPEEGYHLTDDLVDHAIEFVNDLEANRPATPFFMYFAPGAMHFPHQAPKEYIDKYRGRYDEGWDVIREQYFQQQLEIGIIPPNTKLPPMNPGVPPWDELTQNQKNFVCRLQEAWAGFLDHTDAQIGRLIQHLRETKQLENTVTLFTADNGTSQGGGPYGVMNVGSSPTRHATNQGQTLGQALGRPDPEEDFDEIQSKLDEIGGPNSHSDLPWGWAQVGNAPLKWYKRDTHGGGVRVPLIVHYPPGIRETGGIRNQFHYVTDVVPTILEMVNVQPRSSYGGYDQIPISGTSFAYTYEGDGPTEKPIQYFEMMGNRGLWFEGWKAVIRHEHGDDYANEDWELYHLDQDFSEARDLAGAEPERLRKMIDLWWAEAGRNGVLPLDDHSADRRRPIQSPGDDRETLTYRFSPPIAHIPRVLSPSLGQGQWSLTADVEVSSNDSEGTIYSQGSNRDGFALFLQDETLNLVYTSLYETTTGRSSRTLPRDRTTVGLMFERVGDQTGTITFTVDGEEAGVMKIPNATRAARMRGVDIGRTSLEPITDQFDAPFRFTGRIRSITIQTRPK